MIVDTIAMCNKDESEFTFDADVVVEGFGEFTPKRFRLVDERRYLRLASKGSNQNRFHPVDDVIKPRSVFQLSICSLIRRRASNAVGLFWGSCAQQDSINGFHGPEYPSKEGRFPLDINSTILITFFFVKHKLS